MSFHVPEKFRIIGGPLGSRKTDGNNGAFLVKFGVGPAFKVIASDGMGWDHVSVSLGNRCPTWPEMCAIKEMFWDAEDCVVQYHPPESDYVNNHEFCLHLWKPAKVDIARPPSYMVGTKAVS